MNLRNNEVHGKGILRKLNRMGDLGDLGSLADPGGFLLLLASSAVLLAVALLKARGLPFKRSRDGVPRR